jgi:hypothetical protein
MIDYNNENPNVKYLSSSNTSNTSLKDKNTVTDLETASSFSSFSTLEISDDEVAAMDESLFLAWAEDRFDELMYVLTINPHLRDYKHSDTDATPLMIAAGNI